jgi:YVTN family beta-propeller protein
MLMAAVAWSSPARAEDPPPCMKNHYILLEPCGYAEFAYIGNLLSDYVTVVDTRTNTVVATIDVGQHTAGIAVNSAGTRAYAANDHNVVVIDTATNAVVATIEYQADHGMIAAIAVNPAGTRLYVTDQWREGVTVIDTSMNTVITTVPTGYHAFGITVNPEGTRVYATSPDDDRVSVIDAVTNTLVANIPIDNPYTHPPVSAGDFSANPGGIVVDPTGTRVYVANGWLSDQAGGNGHMTVIDAASNTILVNVPAGPTIGSRGIAINPEGTRLYLGSGAVIDTASNSATGALASSASELAINPAGTRIYAVQQTPPGLLVVDAATGVVIATIPLEGSPVAIGRFTGQRGQ